MIWKINRSKRYVLDLVGICFQYTTRILFSTLILSGMRSRLVVALFLLFSSFASLGQTVTVLDDETNLPISYVFIRSADSNKGAVTDENGKADISSLSDQVLLIFSHHSYVEQKISFKSLEAQRFIFRMVPNITRMEDFVISASRWEQDKREVPNKIVEIRPSDIAFSNPPTMADALASSGQVFVQKSQLGGGSPMIRGFAANSVLIVVDGVRINNANFRSGNLQNVINLDPNNVQRAEVIFGPSSVLYGSDALGGVMHFQTKDPKFSENLTTDISGTLFTRYSSASNENTYHFSLNYGGPIFSSFSAITFSDFGDLRTGNQRTDEFPDFGKRFRYVETIDGVDQVLTNENVNKQVQSGYDQFNLLQKFKLRLKSSEFTYSGHLSTASDIPRYDRLILNDDTDTPQFAEWYYGLQDWQMHSLRTSLYNSNRFFSEANITAAYQQFGESRVTRRFQSPNRTIRLEKVDVLSLNADFDKELSENQQLHYGIELIENTTESSASSFNTNTELSGSASTRYPDGGSRFASYATYLNYKWTINPKTILTTGVRYNTIDLNSKFVDDTFFDFPFDEINLESSALSGSVGLVVLPKEDAKLSFLFSSGFRAPNIDDVGKVFDSEPGNVVVPNPDLKPEYSYNFEVGLEQNLNSQIKFNGVLYYSILRDALVRRDFTFNGQNQIMFDGVLSNVQAQVNAGEAYVFGFSTGLEADLDNGLNFKGTVTYTEGEDTIDNIRLRHVPPVFGQFSLGYKTDNYTLEMFSQFSGSISFEDLPPSEQNKTHIYTPDGALSWATLNLRGSFKFSEFFDLNVSLENLFDTHYRPYSSGISAPGFNAIISLRGNF